MWQIPYHSASFRKQIKSGSLYWRYPLEFSRYFVFSFTIEVNIKLCKNITDIIRTCSNKKCFRQLFRFHKLFNVVIFWLHYFVSTTFSQLFWNYRKILLNTLHKRKTGKNFWIFQKQISISPWIHVTFCQKSFDMFYSVHLFVFCSARSLRAF